MGSLSKLANISLLAAAGACFVTAVAVIYILKRTEKEEKIYKQLELFKTTSHTVIEVEVPVDVVGGVIGRNGANILKIQEATSTTIKFKDEGSSSRIALIRGKPNDAQTAERLIRSAIAEKLNVVTAEMYIPIKACGFIIGKNGTTIREICQTSNAKVVMEKESSHQADIQRITLKGNVENIESAKMMIEEKVATFMKKRTKDGDKLSIADRSANFNLGNQLRITETSENGVMAVLKVDTFNRLQVEELVSTAQDGFLEVFVSSVETPDRFWVQPAASLRAADLDKLVDNMSDFYAISENAKEHSLEEINVGDLVAAPFPSDNAWYRARVVSVEVDDYDVSNSDVRVFHVDYGGHAVFKVRELASLRDDFQDLPFQASECKLAGVAPSGGETWSEDAIREMETLTHCAMWSKMMLKVDREEPATEHNGTIKTVRLVDTNKKRDVDTAKELVQKGFAKLTIEM